MNEPRDAEMDRGWAWVICAVVFASNACTNAATLSFGMILVELTEYFGSSHAITVWIIGITECLCQVLAPVVIVLAARYSYRAVVLGGVLVCVTGLVLSFLTNELYQLFLTLGIIAGAGMGLIYSGCLIYLHMWFDKKLGLANGFASAGTGFGIFALSPLTEFLIEQFGWRGTLLLLGGIISQMAWLGMLLREKTVTPPKLEPLFDPKTQDYEDDVVKEDVRSELLPDDSEGRSWESNLDISRQECSNNLKDSKKSKCFHLIRKAVNPALFENKQYIVYLVCIVFVYFSYMPFIFIPDKAIRAGIEKRPAALLVSIAAACSTISRVIFGFISDHIKHRRIVFGVTVLIGGIAQFVSLQCKTYWSLVIYCVVEGLTNGSVMVLNSLMQKDLLGIDLVADGMSFMLFLWGITPLWIGTFTGWLYDISGGYRLPFIVVGSFLSVAGVLLIFLPQVTNLLCCRLCAHRKKARETKMGSAADNSYC